MIQATVGDNAPDALREALEGARVELSGDPDVAFVWFDTTGVERLSELASRDIPAIAVCSDAGEAAAARQAGACDVFVGIPSSEVLQEHLERLRPWLLVWRRRLAAHERRAQLALDELASTQELLERLIDATPNPVMAADLSGRVLVFNRVAEEALGYSARYAREHMHVTDVYANPRDAHRVLEEIRSAPNGLIEGIEVRLRARSGEHIPVVLAAGEVRDASGTPIATVGVFKDQREQISLRNRLEATTEQLIASEKRAATIEVAGAAAHELNQPLTAVMGILELLELRAEVPDEVADKLRRAYSQLERMAEIVRALARTTRPRTTGYVGATRILELNQDQD